MSVAKSKHFPLATSSVSSYLIYVGYLAFGLVISVLAFMEMRERIAETSGFLFILLALNLGAAWLLAKTVLKLAAAYELSTKGVLAEGEVEDFWIEWGVNSDGERRAGSHYISYSFGQGFSGREKLKKHIYRSIKTEDSLKIRYLERDPQIFRLEIE